MLASLFNYWIQFPEIIVLVIIKDRKLQSLVMAFRNKDEYVS